MKPKIIAGLTLAAVLAACQAREAAAPTATDTVAANAIAPMSSPASDSHQVPPTSSVTPGAPGAASGLPDDRTPLSEPRGPIDPKSAEAAGQVMQSYGALLEEKKFGAARALWGDGGKASGSTGDQFAGAYAKYRDIHAEVGKPGDTEGAAGSIYVEVPFRLFGTLKSGGTFNLIGPVTLRRVNDVDGSTAEQRRWHIASSGLKPRP